MRVIKILKRKTDGKNFWGDTKLYLLCLSSIAVIHIILEGFQYLFTAFYQIRVMKISERKTDGKTFRVILCCTYCTSAQLP